MPEIIVSRRKTEGNHVAFVLETESAVSAHVARQRQQRALGVFSRLSQEPWGHGGVGWKGGDVQGQQVSLPADRACLLGGVEPEHTWVYCQDTFISRNFYTFSTTVCGQAL